MKILKSSKGLLTELIQWCGLLIMLLGILGLVFNAPPVEIEGVKMPIVIMMFLGYLMFTVARLEKVMRRLNESKSKLDD